ncbi:WD40 repeat domain-containing protein [Gemmata obscuriglobus]|uniref:WD40 repeat domain-containing protein n=1 Tax=Gemmata obscuriglobus TaxID=114 RepID=UPI0008FBAD29|nr:WD40 repeat domain-containing protein [Gemmata obscuriglobus]
MPVRLINVCTRAASAGEPPTAPPPKPASSAGLPEGAVARLGQTRLRHAERPTCVAFAPDGSTFVTGGEDGTVRVWSAATGDMVRMTQKTGYGVSAVQYTKSGKQLAVHYTAEHLIRLLDPGTLREIDTVACTGTNRFAFSANGKLLATNDGSGNLVITEVELELPKLELTGTDVFAFRPDGKAIAVGNHDGTVAAHLITGGKRTLHLAGKDRARGVSYSPDGKRLAVGSRAADGTDTVRVYTDRAALVSEVPEMNVPLAWLTNDRLAVSNGTDAGIYDLAKNAFTAKIRGAAGSVAISPDGSKLVATGNGGLRVRLWDLPSGKQLHAENDRFPAPALMIGTTDGESLFLLSNDAAFLWPVGRQEVKARGVLPGPAVAAAVGGSTLLVATAEGVVAYSEFDPMKPLAAKPTRAFDKSAQARAVAVAPDGHRIAWADSSGAVVLADLMGDERTRLPLVTSSVLALAFSPDGTKLAQFGRDGFLRLWPVNGKGRPADEVWKARVGRGLRATIAFSPDGKLVTAASRAQVPIFSVADGSEVFKTDRHSEEGLAQHVAFSTDSRLLIIGTSGTAGGVEVWDVARRRLARRFLTGYGDISRLCVFPDGNRIASAGAEEAVTVWDLTKGGTDSGSTPGALPKR